MQIWTMSMISPKSGSVASASTGKSVSTQEADVCLRVTKHGAGGKPAATGQDSTSQPRCIELRTKFENKVGRPRTFFQLRLVERRRVGTISARTDSRIDGPPLSSVGRPHRQGLAETMQIICGLSRDWEATLDRPTGEGGARTRTAKTHVHISFEVLAIAESCKACCSSRLKQSP